MRAQELISGSQPRSEKLSTEIHCFGLVVLAVAVCFSARAANADAYAYSYESVSSMTFSDSAATVQETFTQNRAHFDGYKFDEKEDKLDAKEAKSGPGPFPDQNSFGPFGMQGQYARADSIITGADPIKGLSGKNVAEGFSTSRKRIGFSQAVDYFRFFLTPSDPTKPIVISFSSGGPNLQVSTTQQREQSIAKISFGIYVINKATQKDVLIWRPNGDPKNDYFLYQGSVSNVMDPYNLNPEIRCFTAGCSDMYNKSAGNFSLSYTNPNVKQYQVVVRWEEVTYVNTAPEPSCLLLLGSGVLGVAGVLRKRIASGI